MPPSCGSTNNQATFFHSLFCKLSDAQEHPHLLEDKIRVAHGDTFIAGHFGYRHAKYLDHGDAAGGTICGRTMHPAGSSSPIGGECAVEVRNLPGSDDGRELRIAATADSAVGESVLWDDLSIRGQAPAAAGMH